MTEPAPEEERDPLELEDVEDELEPDGDYVDDQLQDEEPTA